MKAIKQTHVRFDSRTAIIFSPSEEHVWWQSIPYMPRRQVENELCTKTPYYNIITRMISALKRP